ncbi:MAG: tetratricopeptide repeat protein [Anaerolineales bacterium]|nr:tetratricopeptide repeat protein [Anaerolineales bacterium]
MSKNNGNGNNHDDFPLDDMPSDDDASEVDETLSESEESDTGPQFDDSMLKWFGDWSGQLNELEEEEDEELEIPSLETSADDKLTWFGDFTGLPEEWLPDEIPTWDEIEESARKKLLRLAARLHQHDGAGDSAFLREVAEVLKDFGHMPAMLPAVYSFALHFRDTLQNTMQFDLWRSVLISLLFAIRENKDKFPEAQDWINNIWRSIANMDYIFKSPQDLEKVLAQVEQSAHSGDNQILSRAAYLRAAGAQLGVEGIKNTADALLKLAGKDLYQQLQVHLAAGFAYHRLNELVSAFIHGQQAFLIAHYLANQRQEMIGISLMTSLPLTRNKPTELLKLLFAHWQSLPRNLRQSRFWLYHFYGQIIPFYCCMSQHYEQGARLGEQALRLIGDRMVHGRAEILHGYGMSLARLKRFDEAIDKFEEARNVYGYYQRPEYQVAMTHAIGWVQQLMGNCEASLAILHGAYDDASKLASSDVRTRLLSAIEDDINKCKGA